ncbi:MAG: DUF922 domain-containing Zn-dependent protease [Gammaproteobacteria bacterium]|nr:DUF922 domain-containing Zn-dependent protease [Gammaproteobacteria bacterium]
MAAAPVTRRGTAITLALAAALGAAAPAASEPVTVDYYDVHGDTLLEVARWMDRNGPAGDDGRRFHGYTRWQVSWRYQFKPGRDACATAAVDIDLKVTMQLPRWRPPERVPAATVREWERYMVALRAHEDGHAAIGAAVAEAIRRELAAMRSPSGCAALAEAIERRASQILDDHKARELAYDASTDHGATQGARLRVGVFR